MSIDHQIAANRGNARLSTGPRTAGGKARSASNNLRHGLASGRLILPGEDPADFDELVEGLRAEYDPATPTESQLILRMAQNFWLSQRAIRLQNDAFLAGYTPDKLALLLRYQTSNDRGYHRCLTTLLKLKGVGQNRTIGFESQNRMVAEESAAAERQSARMLPWNTNIVLAQREDPVPTTTEAPTAFRSDGPTNAVKDSGPPFKAA